MGATGQSEYQTWVAKTAKDIVAEADNPNSVFSMGDLESIAMAYAMTHNLDEDKVIDALRNEVDRLSGINQTPPIPTGQFWNNNDLDKALQYIKTRPQDVKKLLAGIAAGDKSAVQSVIQFGWAEGFDQYDSDVAEQFINQYEKIYKK